MNALASQMDAVMHVDDVGRFHVAVAYQKIGMMTTAPGVYAPIEPEATKRAFEWPTRQAYQAYAMLLGQGRLTPLGKNSDTITELLERGGLFESVTTGPGAFLDLANSDGSQWLPSS